MDKKGFTLIEMLAIIALLSILITLVILKVKPAIDESKKSTGEVSISSLVSALEDYYFEAKLKGGFNGCSYDFNTDNNTCIGFSFTGDKPSEGVINLDVEGQVSGTLVFNDRNYDVINNKVYKSVPTSYVRLDYIESTGEQYIDTGVSYDEDNEYVINCDVAVTSSTSRFSGWNGGGIFGIASSSWQDGVGHAIEGFDIFEKTNIQLIIEKELSSDTIMTVTQGDNTDSKSRTHPSIKNYAGMNYPIFAYTDNNGGLYRYISMKLWNMRISINDKLVRDFVPCYRKTDGVSGLYDVINDKFYTNSGTGEFVKGEF